MAKSTSKSSKAKTKTTKSAASAKKAQTSATKSAKTVKKTEKPVETKAAKSEVKATVAKKKTVKTFKFAKLARNRNNVTTTLLTKWHAISAGVFIVLAVLAGTFIKSTPQDITLGHLTNDALLSQNSTVFVAAQRVMWSVDLRWLAVATLTISALFSLARYRAKAFEDRGLRARILPLRWIDYAVTGGMMVFVTGLLSGVTDGVELKLLAGLAAISMVFAWVAERENANAERFVKMSFIASVLTGLLVMVSIDVHAVATLMYGMIRSPWYTYALYAVGTLVGLALTVLQVKTYRHIKQWTNYHVVERDYMVLNLLAKTAFAVILIMGLRG